ncbi:hypothetical protein COCC4DRAFT_129215 [Bipolaris maydis ATCC 48331]|uniref:Uncharacterized protein n=2 Tax=Cochliobolus heterostrophus TaxID=5016 RepID=M2UVI6_COCH5|nr:uncharacterized protein COCC4DRAFT_129215 [Bipolaris maydis ATCC 48331]EMD91827.1 hypothetical protein COCHEDRAFT_1101633 [Bipolaris maydis C5]ENI08414.1 hypothetical protein COCC4DRAFT_129215 [Bipolaris maydis ATCC 48331]
MGLASRIRLRFRGRVHVVVVVVVVRCGGDEHSPPFAGEGARLGAGHPIRAADEIALACASQRRHGWPLANASHPLRAGVVVVVCPRIARRAAETPRAPRRQAVRLRALRSVSRPHPLTSTTPATAHVKLEPERATHARLARLTRLMPAVHLHARHRTQDTLMSSIPT